MFKSYYQQERGYPVRKFSKIMPPAWAADQKRLRMGCSERIESIAFQGLALTKNFKPSSCV